MGPCGEWWRTFCCAWGACYTVDKELKKWLNKSVTSSEFDKSSDDNLNGMNDKFWDLNKEKQDRMINAALKVFASNGYRKSSTDEIVKLAQISKGLLFHYFESKQGLYTFVYEYSAKYMQMEYERALSYGETDFFILQSQLELAKTQVMRNYPYMNEFLNQAFLEEDAEIVHEVADVMDAYSACIANVYARADLSRFKQDVDPSKLLKIVLFTVDGLRSDHLRMGKCDPDALYEETMEYLTMLRSNMMK